jgi:hypothetical protein
MGCVCPVERVSSPTGKLGDEKEKFVWKGPNKKNVRRADVLKI